MSKLSRMSQVQVDASFQALVDRLAMSRIWCPLGKSMEDCPRFRKKCDAINCAAGFSKDERRRAVGST